MEALCGVLGSGAPPKKPQRSSSGYITTDVRYRRFFIHLQEELDHVLEVIPIEVTVPFAENFTLITCYLLDKLSNMVADCHCFCGSKGRFVD